MTSREAQAIVDKINAYLSDELWFDFEVQEYVGYSLSVMGGIDPSAPPAVEVVFHQVFFTSMPMEWRTDTTKPPLHLVDGEEHARLCRRFQVEHGYHIFKFLAEGYPDDFGCYVAAREIELRVVGPAARTARST